MNWKPIKTAPKDCPILGWCNHASAQNLEEDYSLYAAHQLLGMSYVADGPNVLIWGGAWDDSIWETPGGSLPDWWFLYGSDFEIAANPTHWLPIPKKLQR